MGERVSDDKLTLSVYVEPTRYNDGSDKGWWIAHQVIWALNTIFNSNKDANGIVELNQNMFVKYQDSKLLIGK